MNINIGRYCNIDPLVQKRILSRTPYKHYMDDYPYVIFYDKQLSVFIHSVSKNKFKLTIWEYISNLHDEIKVINLGKLHNASLIFAIAKYIDDKLYDDIYIYYHHILPFIGEDYATRSICDI